MAIKERRITCKDCGQRVSVWRGERGPLPERCDTCREERKREKTRARVQELRDKQRRGY